jgi:hypothetical protein
VVPVAATKVWLVALKPFVGPVHHFPAVVSSIATALLAMLVPAPAFEPAVPVIVPVQLLP